MSTENKHPSLKSALNASFEATIRAIAEDMPVLMHGAGDVPPDQVDLATVQLLAALTVQHIGQLVDAAIDSREMLLDHQQIYHRKKHKRKNQGRQVIRRPDPPLPPPAFQRTRQPRIPPPPDEEDLKKASAVAKGKADSKKKNSDIVTDSNKDKRKRQPNVEYWDDPLPEPKIRRNNSNNDDKSSVINETRTHSIAETTSAPINEYVHVDEWVGVAGVDLMEHRCRAAYVRGPAATITTQSFIFPVCHDVYTFGKIRELQSAKRTTFSHVLEDPVITEIVRTEGLQHYKKKKKKHLKDKKDTISSSGNISDPEDEDDMNSENGDVANNDEDGPMWPGLEDILPVHSSLTSFARTALGGTL